MKQKNKIHTDKQNWQWKIGNLAVHIWDKFCLQKAA